MACGRKIIFFSLLALCGAAVLFGTERELIKFAESTGIELQWEPFLEIGTLSVGYKTFKFRPGEPWILLDYEAKFSVKPLFKRNGILFIPEETADFVRGVFFPKKEGGPRIGAIFIDPGHGGKDPGTIGRHKHNGQDLVLYEKDIVLAASLELGDLLRKRFPDKQVVFSRTDDRYLTLEERPELANAVKLEEQEAIVFISVHANASLNSKAKGYEVWYLPSHYRRTLLSTDNLDEETKSILPILNTMLEEEYTIESILLAKYILQGFDEAVGDVSENRGLKDESWFVVRKAKMPSVLVEIGFVTHPEEAKRLADPQYLKKIARAVYNGVVSFIEYFDSTHSKGNKE